MRNKRWYSVVVLLLLAAFVVTACGGGNAAKGTGNTGNTATTASGPDKDQYLNLNLGEEPPSLDSGVSTDSVSFIVLNAVQEGLTRYGPDGKLQMALASKVEKSADGKTYTFTIRDGAKWSDGKPVTAQDFEYAWKRALDPRLGSQYAYQLYYLVGAQDVNGLTPPDPKDTKKYPQGDKDPKYKTDSEAFNKAVEAGLAKVGVTAKDDKTLVVTLAQPTVYWLGLTAFPTYFPVRKDIVEKYGDKYATDADKMVYSGPFVISEWTHQSKLVLTKNTNYWDAATVKLQKVNFEMIKDVATPVNQFDAGQLDSIGVPGDYIKVYKDKGILKTMADAVTWYLEFNLDPKNPNKTLANPKIRQAIAIAFDRQAYVDNVLKNGSLPATALTPPSIHDQEGNSFNQKWVGKDLFPKTAEVDKAKQLLAEGLKELNLKQLPEITFLAGDSELAKRYSAAITANISQNLGIKFKLVNVDFKTRLQMMKKGQFDMVYAGWGADYDDPETFMNLFDEPNGLTSKSPDLYSDKTNWNFNDPHWANDEYTQLDLETQKTADNTTRMQDFAKMEQILAQDVAVAPMYWPAANYVEQPWVKGIVRRSTGPGLDLKWAYTEGRK